MQDSLVSLISTINSYLFDYIVVILLVAVGLWYSFQTKFVQVRCFIEGAKTVFKGIALVGEQQKIGITQFQSFLNAVGAQVGTGNIVGAAGAILVGGPGAIFWMWVMAFLGMATMYAEIVCALATRKIDLNGNITGGSVYYILEAFKGRLGKFLATFFAVTMIMYGGIFACMLQSNAVSETLHYAFDIPNLFTGILLTVFTALIFKDGLERITAFTEKIVPIMSYLFIGGAVAVLVARMQYVPEAVYLIFYYAFEPQAIIGGGFGEAIKTAVSMGVKRGIFSNEAGMGTIPHAHIQSSVKDPHSQGVIAMLGVFFDTFVILTLNALVIISTLYTSDGILANGYKGDITAILNAENLSQFAFGSVLDAGLFEGCGAQFVAVCLLLFTFSTILVTFTFGQINAIYLFGQKAIKPYFIAMVICNFIGSLGASNLIWEISDLGNGLIVIPNVLALFALTHIVKNSCIGLKK